MKQRILLTGKDGIDLLQRITTLDMKRMQENVPQPGLFLNAQGKILCYFDAIKKPGNESVEIQFENQFLELLDQYTFSERYQIQKITPSTEQQNSLSEADRIQQRIPKEGNEFIANGETNPLEVNLQNAIHDQKGCYPGQEVIEKIIAIGSPAKRLCLVKIQNPTSTPSVPMELDFGKLTSFEHPFGLAIVRKTHTSPGTVIEGAGFTFEILKS